MERYTKKIVEKKIFIKNLGCVIESEDQYKIKPPLLTSREKTPSNESW